MNQGLSTYSMGQAPVVTDPRFRDFSSANSSLAYGGPGLDLHNPYEYGGYQPQQLSPFSQGMKNFSLGANAFTGLAGAYNAYQLRQLGEEQFDIEKSLINRNLANESLAYNDQINQRAKAGLGLQGIDPGTPGYKKALAAATKDRQVDGTPIA